MNGGRNWRETAGSGGICLEPTPGIQPRVHQPDDAAHHRSNYQPADLASNAVYRATERPQEHEVSASLVLLFGGVDTQAGISQHVSHE